MTMTKVQTLTDPDSKINIADPKEPVWVLRGIDPLAPQIIREWASRYIIDGVNHAEDGIELAKKLEVYKETMQTAKDMEHWREEHLRMEAIHDKEAIKKSSPLQ